MNKDIVEQIRSLLVQGNGISIEHASERRFKTSSWKTGAPIQGTSLNQVLSDLEACLAEYQGEYVRVIGVDPKAKRRVSETIIQRPSDRPGTLTGATSGSSPSVSSGGSTSTASEDLRSQVKSLLDRGYGISIEHASERRFKTSSWKTGAPIQEVSLNQVLADLQTCLAEYEGEYVRLIGVDPKAKRRVLETIIQRPNQKTPALKGGTASAKSSSNGTVAVTEDLSSQVKSLLAQGYRIGTEHASERRFKTSSWQTCPMIEATTVQGAIAELEACLADHQGEYVRLIGIDPNAKRRVLETVIQRPNGKALVASSSKGQTPSYTSTSSNSSSYSTGSSSLSSETLQQVRSLLAQGYRIGSEHTDKRRFKIGSWKSCSPIESQRDAEVIAALEACMTEHAGEYVRLLGIDSKQKRRVAETIIQRPTAAVR